jgi:hypothetical protein
LQIDRYYRSERRAFLSISDSLQLLDALLRVSVVSRVLHSRIELDSVLLQKTMYQVKKYAASPPGAGGLMSSQTTTPSPHLAAAERASVLYGSDGMNSADPKPRLRWTPELHERFVDAVTQLGGADSKPPSAALLPSFSFVLHYFLVPTPFILAAPRQGSVPFFLLLHVVSRVWMLRAPPVLR